MNELINSANVSGTYDEMLVNLNSNLVIVQLVEGLTIQKKANKKIWINGPLTYTLIINNNTSIPHENVVVTDYINSIIATLINKTVTIDNVIVDESKYSFDSGTLKIQLDIIKPNSETVITFKVKKIADKCFKLENTACLNVNDHLVCSNNVIVIIHEAQKDDWIGCDKPYLGYR